jgi:riboflavin kinase/FMN adenylyltransferase
MQVIGDLTKVSLRQETILTIGTFDGVHLGHQALIKQVVARAWATERLAALITFHPHPAVVLAPDRAPRYLTTPGEKLALVEKLGVDLVVLLPFDRRMAETPAHQFMERVSVHLQLRELWIGADFALGRNREGDAARLREFGRNLGYEVQVSEPVLGGDQVISSSRIRALLNGGRVQEVTALLGRYHSLSGEVVVGVQRGRTLGFPTANLEVRPERAVPADGVYAVFAVLGTERYAGVANIGVRPSFDNGHRMVETHIFDFDQNIYGCDLVVEFVARLRDERRFEDIDDLVAQIELDSQAARRLLGTELETAGRVDAVVAGCHYRYREVEHTADRALEVWGRDLPDLFAGSARGMYSLMGELNGLLAEDWRTIQLEAWDRETLLVDWLNELLFLTEMEGWLLAECHIKSLCDSAGAPGEQSQAATVTAYDGSGRAGTTSSPGVTLAARVGGVYAPLTGAHIKAVTYHNLALVQDETGWSTVITFDV